MSVIAPVLGNRPQRNELDASQHRTQQRHTELGNLNLLQCFFRIHFILMSGPDPGIVDPGPTLSRKDFNYFLLNFFL